MKTCNLINSDALKQAKRTREGQPVTDEQIAEALGVTRQSVNCLFNGKSGSLTLLQGVCRVLGVRYRDFLLDDISEENQAA